MNRNWMRTTQTNADDLLQGSFDAGTEDRRQKTVDIASSSVYVNASVERLVPPALFDQFPINQPSAASLLAAADRRRAYAPARSLPARFAARQAAVAPTIAR